MAARRARRTGFTLIELLIVVALVAVIISLVAPSFRDYMLKERLRGIHAQLVTDLQFARSEAVSRGTLVGVRVQVSSGMTCYMINTRTSLSAPDCDCSAAAGSRCSDPTQTTEIRAVQIPTDMAVQLSVPPTQNTQLTFDPRNGALRLPPSDFGLYDTGGFIIDAAIDSPRVLRAVISVSGRITPCAPSGSRMGGPECT